MLIKTILKNQRINQLAVFPKQNIYKHNKILTDYHRIDVDGLLLYIIDNIY